MTPKKVLKISEFQNHLEEFIRINKNANIMMKEGKEKYIVLEKTFHELFGYSIILNPTSPLGFVPDDSILLINDN